MTLVSTIIRDGYREGNVISINEEITAAQEDEGLRIIQRIVASVYGNEEGEQLQTINVGEDGVNTPVDFPIDADWFLPLNIRLAVNATESREFNLHPSPIDGSRISVQDIAGNLSTYPVTLVGNGRTIGGDTSLVVNTDGANVTYIFRADLGDWVIVSPIESSDEFPFPIEFDDLFISALAMRLNPRYGVDTPPETVEILRRSRSQFRSRYRQTRQAASEMALLRTSGTYRKWQQYSSPEMWARGSAFYFPFM